MRLFVNLMVVVLIAALAGPFFIKGPDGRPLMSVDDLTASITSTTARLARTWDRLTTRMARSVGNDHAGKTRVYRWRDENGQWHYADEPPPDGQSEAIYVDPEVNVLPATPVASPPPDVPDNAGSDTGSPDVPLPLILNPGAVKDAIDEAKDVRDQVEKRNAEIERRIDET